MAQPLSFNGPIGGQVVVEMAMSRRLQWRIRLGLLVIQLGCWIATIGFKTEEA